MVLGGIQGILMGVGGVGAVRGTSGCIGASRDCRYSGPKGV